MKIYKDFEIEKVWGFYDKTDQYVLLMKMDDGLEKKTLEEKRPIIIAHRGACGEYPEHTLEGYEKAIEMGADYIEQDVVMTRDGHLIVRHEPNLIHTTDVSTRKEFASRFSCCEIDHVMEEGYFAFDFSLEEIKTLFAVQARRNRPTKYDGMFRIPTFEEVLQLRERLSKKHGREIGIYVETKHPTFHREIEKDLESPLTRLLQQYNLDQNDKPVMVQSFEPSSLKIINTLLPKQTTIKKILLLDGTSVDPNDGSIVSYRPFDFIQSDYDHYHQDNNNYNKKNARTFADLLATTEELKEIKTYADGIGPWKPYIHSYVYQNKTGDGDVSNLANHVLLPCPTDLVQKAHEVGLLVHPFTFRSDPDQLLSDYQNDPQKEYKHFFELGVDGVFTDFSDAAVQAKTHIV